MSMTDDVNVLRKQLEDVIRRTGKTNNQIAYESGVSVTSLHRFRNDEKWIFAPRIINRIANFLEKHLEDN